MLLANRSSRSRSRNRSLRPVMVSLEDRVLLNAAMPHDLHGHSPSAEVRVEGKQNHQPKKKATGPTITTLNSVTAGGFTFINFNGPNAGTNAAAGTNQNGISNSGTSVGFDIDNNGGFHNFTVNPLRSRSVKVLNINGSTTAMAFGTNSSGTVVGTDGNGNAFTLSNGKLKTFIPPGGMSAVAFGINDMGTIVGQDVTANGTPGFIRVNPKTYITINAPSGPNVVNAQSINNKGLVVGFYVGTDGQDHGFMANEGTAKNGTLTGTAITDPTIPTVAGEPGATFVFSQILGSTTTASPWATTATPRPVSMALSTTPTPASTPSWMIPARRSITAWKSPRSRALRTRANLRDSTPTPMGSSTASSPHFPEAETLVLEQ